MGAWGTGVFDNDGAGDFLALLQGAEPGQREVVIREAFEAVTDPDDYLEVDAGQEAIAAAAVIAAVHKYHAVRTFALTENPVSLHFTRKKPGESANSPVRQDDLGSTPAAGGTSGRDVTQVKSHGAEGQTWDAAPKPRAESNREHRSPASARNIRLRRLCGNSAT